MLAVTLGIVLSRNDNDTNTPEQVKHFKIIDTKAGKIQGKIISIIKDDGQEEMVYRFRNIPYAEPPIGNLRWKPPQRARRWNETLTYSDKQIWCKQPPLYRKDKGVEDCLILTIRQPASANASSPYPVLFWIHGGGLLVGSSDMYYLSLIHI